MNQRTGLILRDLDIILKEIVSLKLKKEINIFNCMWIKVRNLLSATTPDQKTFKEFSKLVQDHLNPELPEVI